jgi:hypothetical protein
VIPKEFKGSYNLGSFPRLETHWRDREIRSIITGGDKKSKELLRRFAPFDDIIAASLRILVPQTVPQTDLPGINWHAFFPGSLNLTEPSNIAADISTASWTCFQQVPFYSWARLALGFEDKAVHSFKWCHEGLKLHVWHYLRTHVDQLPRFLLLIQVRLNISMHNPRFWILSVITGFRTAEPFRIFCSILRYQHFPYPPTG